MRIKLFLISFVLKCELCNFCRIYIYDAACDDRSGALMELKLRDAPLAMKYVFIHCLPEVLKPVLIVF